MGVLALIIFIISVIVASKIVNSVYQMYMKMMGASYMTYNKQTKIVALFIVTIVVMGCIIKFLSIFGIVFQ